MSTNNGRRAWRKWARTQRGAFGMGFKDPGFARRHPFRDKAKPIGMKNARPARRSVNPFTPRSFVGMSESCKKRLARRSDAVRFATTNPAACAFTAEQARALGFRIGERLRPCAGCCACFYRSDPVFADGICEDCGKAHATCDGSGVLPARPRSARW